MPASTQPARRRRPRGAGLAVLLCLVTATLTPLFHANGERLASAATYEAHHSAQCLPLHDEAVCPTCGAHQTIGSTAIVTTVDETDALVGVPCTADAIAPPAPSVAPPTARAPPLR